MRRPVHIIIAMAGHSRRFLKAGYNSPKAFIEVGDKKMIEHVVDMFDPRDHYHFVINSDQANSKNEYAKFLKSLAKNVTITIIASHEKGPTFSALQVKEIPADEEVIVSYCDFCVQWNYERFLREVRNYDAAVPTFKGFHPASFGDTYYAYIRANQNEFLELREKQSFTDDRANEHASVGIYYFSKFSTFCHYGQQLLDCDQMELPEAYTSLLFNPMKADKLDILVYQVEKFICLGTPQDLAQYLFWYDYFKKYANNTRDSHTYDQTNLIPIAGKGTRFVQDGYRVIKPLIQIDGDPMILRVCNSFPQAKKWIFMAREDELNKHPIQASLKKMWPSSDIVSVKGDTSGQAATCLLAQNLVDKQKPLFIASGDYESIYDPIKWRQLIEDESIDGIVWTFRFGQNPIKNPNAFAYCQLENDGQSIQKIVEKKTISDRPEEDPMVVGSFWYRQASDFFSSATSMIEKKITVGGEHYVGTSINQLIEQGKKFAIFDITQWISYGDPFELNIYEYWEDYFYHIKL